MITASEINGLMAMMPAFATDDAGDPRATATISLPRLEAGLNRMIGDGANVISTTGSFGEFHALSLEEFETITNASAEIVAGRVPLFIGVTSLNTREVVRKHDSESFGIMAVERLDPFGEGLELHDDVLNIRIVEKQTRQQ